jgi:hypothetical protein
MCQGQWRTASTLRLCIAEHRLSASRRLPGHQAGLGISTPGQSFRQPPPLSHILEALALAVKARHGLWGINAPQAARLRLRLPSGEGTKTAPIAAVAVPCPFPRP